MKRILLIATALLMLVPFASAQLKSSDEVRKYVEAAKAQADKPKNATKAETWIRLGKAYYQAYTDETGDVQIGDEVEEASDLLRAIPLRKKVGRQGLVKCIFSKVNFYCRDGIVVLIEPTHLTYPNCLELAAAAYIKASQLNPKKNEEVGAALVKIQSRIKQIASSLCELGDNARSCDAFESAYDVSRSTDQLEDDTNSIYCAIMIAYMSGNPARVRDLCLKSLADGFEGDGDVYSKLGDAYGQLQEVDKQKEILESGFAKFPENEDILIKLINSSMNEGDPDYVLKLLAQAKKMDPGNASLWYAEGNMFAKIKTYDKAAESYRKSIEIDPENIYVYYAEGLMWATRYDELNNEVTEFPVQTPYAVHKEYDTKMKQALLNAIDPFEACFEKGDKDFKDAVAPMLLAIYSLLADTSENYKARYEFFESYLNQ